jgi:hypothetical protein
MPDTSAKRLKCRETDNHLGVNEKLLSIFKTNIYCPPVLFIHFTGATT